VYLRKKPAEPQAQRSSQPVENIGDLIPLWNHNIYLHRALYAISLAEHVGEDPGE